MTSGSIAPPYIIPLRLEQTSKYLIDTNTLLEIRCQTNDVDIYYTLDGSKPDSFITLGTRRSTVQYKKPFYVPRELANKGKITVKAIAVSRNGIKESPIVTENFQIKIVPSDHTQSDEYENRILQELQLERQELMKQLQTEQQPINVPPQSFSKENIYPNFSKLENTLRCAHCFATKTNDSYTRFCIECGLPWKKLTGQPPEIHSIKVCSNCQTTIPFNSNVCVVCETPVGIKQPVRAKTPPQARILCPQCKSSNPTHLRKCYICESNLMPSPIPQIRASVSVPTPAKITGTMLTCPKCFRLNNIDARFCDWCGATPEKKSSPVQCTTCRSSNDPQAKFCLNCGCVMEPPLRVLDARTRPASSIIASTLTNHSINPTLNQSRTRVLINKTEAATQTYGIYYPSAKDLDLLITQNKRLLAEQNFKEHRPMLTSVSPGKGYWKQQLDHICEHLKAYAVNRPEFRVSIGEPRLGKMIHSTLHENDYQVTLQVVFQKPENLARTSVYSSRQNEHYPMNSERSSTYSSTYDSDDEYTLEQSEPKKTKKRSKKHRPKSASISETESPKYALIKLLEKKRTTDHHSKTSDDIKRLLKEHKIDGNVRNKDDYTALQLAVRNGYHDCLSAIIKDGKADVNKKGPRGNTALHECCLLGSNGVKPLEILLKYGGDLSITNSQHETVEDLAGKKNAQELLQVIAKYHGEKMVHQSEKSFYDDRARIKSTNGHRLSNK